MAENDVPGVEETGIALEDAPDAPRRATKKPPFGERKKAKGPLMDAYKDEEGGSKIAKLALRIWKAQDRQLDKPSAQWGVNCARRAGITNVGLRYNSLDEHWTAYLPRNASPDVVPDVNKAADLCRRMTSHMFVDPFVPEIVAPDGDEDAESQVEFSQRALDDIQGEHNLNTSLKVRRAFDKGHNYGSGYIRYIVNSKGTWRRVKVKARSDAEHYDLAFVDPLTGVEGPEMAPTGELDSATGQPQMKPVPFVDRFVDEEGYLTDDPDEALIEWVPRLESEVLDSRHVRLIPHTAPDIWEARGAQVAAMVPWGELKERVPDIEKKLGVDRVKKILSYRPKFAEDLIPGGKNGDVPEMLEGDSGGESEDGKKKPRFNDERLCLVLTTYYPWCDDYPEGLYLITAGDQCVIHRSPWQDESVPGDPKKLDIPLSQVAGFEEGRPGYWKVGLMELVGGGNEIRASQLAGWLDHLDRLNRRKTFLPTNSIIQPDQLLQPRASVLPMNPGGKPEYEDIPPWSADSVNLYVEMGNAMEATSGLHVQDSSQRGSNVKSGRHEFALISQMHAGLSEPRHNVERAFVRCSRIELQLARAFFDDEQEMKFTTANGRFRHQAWTGADLIENPDVRIKPGSGSMLAPAAKAQLAERYAGMGVMTPEELKEVLATNIGGTIGLQDDPHRLRIRGQVAEFMEGPPEGWQPPPPQPQGVNPMTGQALPPPLAPELQQIFQPVPADMLPHVAQVRVKHISDAMADAKYLRFPPAWRMGLDMEFQRMGMALQAAQQQPQGGPGDADAADNDGKPDEGVNKDGSPLNDLQEDALQEGAPPEMVT